MCSLKEFCFTFEIDESICSLQNATGKKLDPRCEIDMHIAIFTFQLYRFILDVHNDVRQFS
jgi:hypothetical protein